MTTLPKTIRSVSGSPLVVNINRAGDVSICMAYQGDDMGITLSFSEDQAMKIVWALLEAQGMLRGWIKE
jgi:hypothetical protein